MTEPLLFILSTALRVFIFLFLIRGIAQWAQLNPYNPTVRALLRLTDPVTKPLRSILGQWARIDIATVLIACILQAAYIYVLSSTVNLPALPLLAIVEVVNDVCLIFIVMLVVGAILSWITPQGSPAMELISGCTNPILRPIRRLLPSGSIGIDFSPLIAILILFLIKNYLIGFLRAIILG